MLKQVLVPGVWQFTKLTLTYVLTGPFKKQKNSSGKMLILALEGSMGITEKRKTGKKEQRSVKTVLRDYSRDLKETTF